MKTIYNTKTLWALLLVAGIFGLSSAGAHTETIQTGQTFQTIQTIQTIHIQQSRMTEAQKQAYDMENQTVQTVVIVGHRTTQNT